jgi:cytochrome c553
VPQIAGQHRKVIIKQLADIRAGNRESVIMAPYASVESIGGTQAIADVAGYIDTLEMSVEMEKGAGDDLKLGAKLYRDNCARCHGETGEGNNDAFVPRIQAQHYEHLVRQFQSIRDGKRRNANAENGDPDPRLQRSSDPSGAGPCLSTRASRGAPRTAGLAQSGLRALNGAPRNPPSP